MIATQSDQHPPVFSIDGRLYQKRDILRYCPSLVVIAEAERHYGTFEELHLAHFSVKEYLLEQAQFDVYSASIVITKTCLTYLRNTNCDNSTGDDFPLAFFSAKGWPKYAVLAEDSEGIMESIINLLQDEKSLKRWLCLYNPVVGRNTEVFGAQALYYACSLNLVATVRYLVAEGADINAQCGLDGSALQTASARGHLEVMRLLLKNGADTNVQYGTSASALQYASARGHLEAMRLLLKNGADVNMTSRGEYNALCLASRCGNIEAIRLLLENGADVNMASEEEGNALCIACRDGKMEIVQLLLSQGANVNAHCGIYGSALEAARANEHSEIVQILLDHVAIDDRKRKRSSSINVRKKAKSCRI